MEGISYYLQQSTHCNWLNTENCLATGEMEHVHIIGDTQLHGGALFCSVPLQLPTACLASAPRDTGRAPSSTGIKLHLQLEGGANGKLDHNKEHFSGWFAVLKQGTVCWQSNTTRVFSRALWEHTPITQLQLSSSTTSSHLLSSNPTEKTKVMLC